MFIKDQDMGGCYAHIHEQGQVSGILKTCSKYCRYIGHIIV